MTFKTLNPHYEKDSRIPFKERCAQCLKGPKQIIRSIVLLTCTIVVVCQIVECLKKISNPPISTYTHFDFNETIMYPAVTLCRDPPYKLDALERYKLYGHPRFTSEWSKFPFNSVNLEDFWNDVTYSKEDNFIENGLNISSDNIIVKSNLHFILGKCQTLIPKIAVSTASKRSGYSISLNHSFTNIDSTPSLIPPGYHVYIHQINEPFSELASINLMEYIYVNVGEEIDIKLTVQEMRLLPNGFKPCNSEENYSSTKCSEECTWDKLFKLVNCSGPWIDRNVSYCLNYKGMRNLIVEYIKLSSKLDCVCPPSCHSYLYSAFVVDRNSLTKWDSNNGKWTLKSGDYKLQTQINMYFNNKMVSVYEENHSYDWSFFLSDFGASLGFLLGLSVLGVIALLEDIFESFVKPLLPKKTDKTDARSNCSKKISIISNDSASTICNDSRILNFEKMNVKSDGGPNYM